MRKIIILLLFVSTTAFATQQATLNFRNLDIQAFIEMVSQFTGKTFIVDSRVQGKVTISSSSPMTGLQIYDVFQSVLSVYGFSIVEGDGILKIVPQFVAKSHNMPFESGDSIVTHVLKLQYVSAIQIIELLRPLMLEHSYLSGYEDLIIVSDTAINVQRMMAVINRIDKPLESDIEIIPLQYSSVSDILPLLQFGKSQEVGFSEDRKQARTDTESESIIADSKTNTLIIKGNKNERLRLRVIISHFDIPALLSGVETIYLKFAKVQKILPVLTGIIESDPVKYAGVSIQGYETINALVLTASAEQVKVFKGIISTLDIRQAQVLVEAVIAEISVDKIRELGIQWFTRQSQGTNGYLAGANFNNSGAGITSFVSGLDGASSSDSGSSPLTLNANAFMGLGRFVNGVLDFGILLQALHSDSKVNVLSTPSLLVLDNEPARISVGQNVPFVTGQYSNSENGGQNAFQTIQRQDVGITLEITPQIGSGGAVRLNVNQEVSSVSRANFAADIITNQRTIQTTVMAQDGGMIVLGGLIHEDLQQTAEKVPFLGDVPALGVLFRSNTASKVKRVLMVFLHPTIIKDSETDLQVARSKYDFTRQYQLSQNQQGTPLMTDSDVPLMDLNQFLTILPNGDLLSFSSSSIP